MPPLMICADSPIWNARSRASKQTEKLKERRGEIKNEYSRERKEMGVIQSVGKVTRNSR
jgi:hypothetical protein